MRIPGFSMAKDGMVLESGDWFCRVANISDRRAKPSGIDRCPGQA